MISRHVGLGLAGVQRHRIASASAYNVATCRLRPTIATGIPCARFESTTTTTPEDTTGHISAASNESIIWIDSELD